MNNYCVLPFNSVSINATGEIRQCCNATGKTEVFITDADIINNDYIKDIRRSFIKDKRHSACERCWKMEDAGSSSFRHYSNDNPEYGIRGRNPLLKENISYTDIEYIDITLGNTCNLACRMCNAYSSSLLAKQLTELGTYKGPIDITFEGSAKQKVLDLFSNAINLKAIYMLGGEPLINPLHDEILQLLIDNGTAKNISLHYNTNLQVNKISKYLDKWEHFGRIDLQASIDGHGSIYNYIRWPGDWNKVYNNLKDVLLNTDKQKYNVSISTTLQNINAENIFTLIDECKNLCDKTVPFFFIPVVGNSTLSLAPNKILKQGINRIENLQGLVGPKDDLLANYVSALKTTPSKQQALEFFRDMKMFDQKRNQNLFTTIPFMEQVADEYGVAKWL
jgi:uncharacterized radical SAM superfamily Fe-S cluster-containing enzyme